MAGRAAAWVACLALAVAGRAAAQDFVVLDTLSQPVGPNFKRDRTIGVIERPRPAWAPVPVPIGPFDATPALTVGARYDDNVFAQEDGKKSDLIGVISGQMLLNSDWNRNLVQIDAHAEYDGYADNTDESHVTGGVGALGRLDLTRSFALIGRALYDHRVESRIDTGAPTFTKHPVEYEQGLAEVGVVQAFNRLKLQADLGVNAVSFDNAETPAGTPVIQDYRDRTLVSGRLRADYALGPDASTYLQITANDRIYGSRAGDIAGYDRNSQGFDAEAGVSFDLRDLSRGEIGVGYIYQGFADPRIANVSGPGARGRLQYFPTGLTTVTFDVERVVADSALAQSPAYLLTSTDIRVDHELLRNVILLATAGYSQADYEGVDRTDSRPFAQAGVTYLMNRAISWKLLYSVLHQSSSGSGDIPGVPGAEIAAGRSFTDNQITLTATARY